MLLAKILTSFVFIILLAASCSKEDSSITTETDEYGVVISKPYKWKFSLHSSDSFNSVGFFDFPIIYNKHIAIPTTNEDESQSMKMIDSKNGEQVWMWNDIYEDSQANFNIYGLYIKNNFLTWQIGKRGYCIDLKTGNTHWKKYREHSFHSKVFGVNNTFIIKGNSSQYPGLEIDVGYRGDLETGEIELFLIPDFSFDYTIDVRCCDVTEMIPYIINGTQHLVVVYQELRSSELWNFQSYLGLYNLETDEWVYDRKIMNEPNLYGVSLAPPKIYDGKFYANIGKELVCHDIETGEQVWSRDFPQDFMFSGFIIEEGKIIAMCEDTILYCLDPETGSTIWETEAAGTSSRMSYLNGVVYFVGGSTRKLHAVDISTGRTVWRIDPRNISDDYGKLRTNAVYVIPGENGEKGKVIALTSMYAICYEAYK